MKIWSFSLIKATKIILRDRIDYWQRMLCCRVPTVASLDAINEDGDGILADLCPVQQRADDLTLVQDQGQKSDQINENESARRLS